MEIEGKRRNSKAVVEDNYIYLITTTRGANTYLNCIEKACRGRAKKKDGIFKVTRKHNHSANQQALEQLQIISACKTRAVTSSLSIKKIFEEECERLPEGAKLVSYRALERSMLRARRKTRPDFPGTPQQYAEMMAEMPRYAEAVHSGTFFRAFIEDNEATMVVFASEVLCQDHFAAATELHVDTTFKAVPDMFLQMMTIHATIFETVLPCVYVLMTHNTLSSYSAVLSYIQEHLAPQLNPNMIITDFEPALMEALQDRYPSAQQLGCWFHYVKSIRQFADNLGILSLCRDHEPTKQVVQSLMSLPLLPPNYIMQGLTDIEIMARDEGPLEDAMNRLFNYVIEEWIQRVKPMKWSVYGDHKRTNNNLDVFHTKMLNTVGALHANVWEFTEALRKVEFNYRQHFERIQQGLAISRSHQQRFLLHDRRLQVAANKLESGQGTVLDYLASTYFATEVCINFITIEETNSGTSQEGSSNENAAGTS